MPYPSVLQGLFSITNSRLQSIHQSINHFLCFADKDMLDPILKPFILNEPFAYKGTILSLKNYQLPENGKNPRVNADTLKEGPVQFSTPAISQCEQAPKLGGSRAWRGISIFIYFFRSARRVFFSPYTPLGSLFTGYPAIEIPHSPGAVHQSNARKMTGKCPGER